MTLTKKQLKFQIKMLENELKVKGFYKLDSKELSDDVKQTWNQLQEYNNRLVEMRKEEAQKQRIKDGWGPYDEAVAKARQYQDSLDSEIRKIQSESIEGYRTIREQMNQELEQAKNTIRQKYELELKEQYEISERLLEQKYQEQQIEEKRKQSDKLFEIADKMYQRIPLKRA